MYKCVCANIEVGVATKLWRENLDSNAQKSNKDLYIQSFFPALIFLSLLIIQFVRCYHVKPFNYKFTNLHLWKIFCYFSSVTNSTLKNILRYFIMYIHVHVYVQDIILCTYTHMYMYMYMIYYCVHTCTCTCTWYMYIIVYIHVQ